MANLSNINNVLRTGSTGIGINCDPEFTLDVERSSASAVLSLNSVGGSGAEYLIFSGTDGSLTFNKRYVGDRLYIASGGNVGIGTSSPDHKLRVNGDARLGNLHIKTSDFGTAGTGKTIYADGAGTGVLGFISTTAFDFSNGSTSRVRIDSSGNVGIGTTSPTADLSVGSTSTSSGDVHLRTTKTTFSMTPSNTDAGGMFLDVGWVSGGQGPLKFGIGGTEKMRIDSSGTIIGTGTYSAGGSIKIFEAQRSGGAVAGDWSYDDATTDMSLGTSTAHSFSLKTGNTRALTINSSQNATFTGTVTFNDHTYHPDQVKSIFGTGSDAEIQFNGSHLFIDNTVGTTYLRNTATGGSGFIFRNSSIGDFEFDNEFAGNIKFNTSNVERMRINSSGNVGIGTTSPSYKLQVNGTAYINETLYVNGATTVDDNFYVTNGNVGIGITSGMTYPLTVQAGSGNNSYIHFVNSTTGTAYSDGFQVGVADGSSDGFLLLRESANMRFYTGGTERMRIDSSGTVSITNQSSDGLIIERTGTTTGKYRFGIGGTNLLTIRDVAQSQTRMAIDSSGNVGIGTTSPSAKLDVRKSGTTAAQGDTDLFVGDSGAASSTAQVQIHGGTSGFSNLYFSDASAYNVGGFIYNHSSNYLATNVNGSERMRIDSSGLTRFTVDSGTASAIDIGYVSSARTIRAVETGGGNARPLTLLAQNFTFKDDTATRMAIDSSGNVQIKTSGAELFFNDNGQIRCADDNHRIRFRRTENILELVEYGDIIMSTGATPTERMRIDSSGNVGIGATSPDEKLHVNGNIAAINSSYPTIKVQGSDVNYQARMRWDTNNNVLEFLTRHAGTYYSDTLVLKQGNVGIGTNSPSYKLSVVNSGNVASFGDGTRAFRVYTDADEVSLLADGSVPMKFYTSGTERMRIDSSGRVGIGTTPDTDADALHLDSSGTNSLKIEGAGSYNLYSYHDSGGVGWATGADTSFTNLLYFDSTNNGIRFYTNSGERMRITSAGAIGIGQTSIPTNTRLNITGTNNYTLSSSSGMGGIKISGTTTGQGNYTSGIGFAFGSGTAGISGVQGTSDADRMGLAFFTHPSGTGSAAAEEKMRIDYLGNVGIGETSPDAKLHVVSTTTPQFKVEYDSTRYVEIHHSAIFNVSGAGQNNDLYIGTRGNSGNNDIVFYTGATTGASAGSERMRITSGGNVGIGLTNPDAKLEVTGGGSAYTFRSVYSGTNGSYAAGAFQLTGGSTGPSLIDFIYSTTFVGQIVTTGTAVLYQSNSDYRLKENVVEMTGALDRVSQLKPNRFNFIADANTTVDGFLAHELQQVVPQAVSGEKDETREDGTPKYQGVDHSQIVPLLVGAIQELKQEIETLKTQINN